MSNANAATSTSTQRKDSTAISTTIGTVDVTTSNKQKEKKLQRKWVSQDIEEGPPKSWSLPEYMEKDMSPTELFELFYDDDIINMIVEFTKHYAHTHGDVSFDVTYQDMKLYLAILLLTGYNPLPRYKMYWETSDDCHNKAVSNAMPRGKFEKISKYLHVCDNANLSKDDKFAKVRPLWNKLNERWLKFYNNEKMLCIDEAMVPYFGRHSTKQHMMGKPVRFGYKVWCLCTRLGYLIQGEPYQGAATGNTRPELGIGLGGSVVLDLISVLPATIGGYDLFFDNFFTSLNLLDELKARECTGTGTVRNNRVQNAPMIDPKILKKEERGSFHQKTDKESGITLVRFHDNSIVTMASNRNGVAPLGKAKRYSRSDKKHIDVPMPAVIASYNAYMGGVDRLDENIGKLRVNYRMKKWYYQLFAFPLNVSVNNAWLLYKQMGMSKKRPLDLLAFTRYITNTYFQKYSRNTPLGRPLRLPKAVDKRVIDDVRYDKVDHMIAPLGKQGRCGQCKKNSTKKCQKCNIPLHANCFTLFHSMNDK